MDNFITTKMDSNYGDSKKANQSYHSVNGSSQYCQSDFASFLVGAMLGYAIAGGRIGFVIGLGVGTFGGLLNNTYEKPF
jgi:hypothetical protein